MKTEIRSLCAGILAIFSLLGCDKLATAPGSSCVLDGQSIGNITLSLSGANVALDWENDLSVQADSSLEVSLIGPTSAAPVATKPAVFTGLADGVWIATVTYSIESTNCSIAKIRSFTVDSSVDCTSWDASTVAATVSITPQTNAQAIVDWTGGNITGEDSFKASLTGATTVEITANKPANFSGLNFGSHTATITYSKTACSDKLATSSATIIPVSLQAHVYPFLNTKCSACHGGNGGFTIGASSTTLYNELTSENAVVGCAPAATNAKRVDTANDPGVPSGAFFYRKISSTDCGTNMAVNGGLSGSEVSTVLTWITEGANNN